MKSTDVDCRAVVSPNNGRVFDHWQPIGAPDVATQLERLTHARSELNDDIGLRKSLLDQCIAGLEQARPKLIDLVVGEVAKKPEEADGEIDYAISFLAHCRDLLEELSFERRLENGHIIKDVGLAGALLICPFNDPIAGLTRKIAPAIAAGCPVILKPSSLSILCALEMFDTFQAHGVRNHIQLLATGDPALVLMVLEHVDIGIVSFTGSTEVGRGLAVKCATAGKKSVMELGGNCPFAVLGDADLDLAIDDLIIRKLKAAGQACSSVNRVFVAESIYRPFKDRLLDRIAPLKSGPSNGAVDLGPVRTRRAANTLVDLVSDARSHGENLLSPAPSPVEEDEPFLFPFTVVESEDESLFDDQETFGPLLSIRPFSNEERLLSRLARERHALVSYFYTADPKALLPKLSQLRFGSIGINSTAIQGPDVPTGGFWEAGHGREGGSWGLSEYLTTVNHKIA
ncbi:MAG: aldehyde dehydrogenase family protein [Hyphomicrobiales bacterium]